jgi:alpha-D-xyloside xylohydrolase
LDKIPVYVKDGGIIPMMKPMLHAPKAGEKVDIEIRHYGEKPGKYLLYDDDGETFDYEKGSFTWRTITVEKVKGTWKGTISAAENGKPNTIGNVTWKFMSAPASPLSSLFEKDVIKILRKTGT